MGMRFQVQDSGIFCGLGGFGGFEIIRIVGGLGSDLTATLLLSAYGALLAAIQLQIHQSKKNGLSSADHAC